MTTVSVLIVATGVFLLLMYMDEKRTFVCGESIKISRDDFGRLGSTEYSSTKPWEKYYEKVNILRFFRASRTITVGESGRVEKIQIMSAFRKGKVIYFRNNATVVVVHDSEDRGGTVHRLGEFKKELLWAERKMEEVRRRYANLMPNRFKQALGVA